MTLFSGKLRNISRMNVFIVLSLFIVTVVSTLIAGVLFYLRSTALLTDIYKTNIAGELEQINAESYERIALTDAFFSHLASDAQIRAALDPAAEGYADLGGAERRIEIERRLSLLTINDYLWDRKLMNAVYIFDAEGAASGAASGGEGGKNAAEQAARAYGNEENVLQISMPDGLGNSVYFVKNIFSSYTGKRMATVVIEVDKDGWMSDYSAGIDENWIVMLYGESLLLTRGDTDGVSVSGILSAATDAGGFADAEIDGRGYFIGSRAIDAASLLSVVAVPKEYALSNLREAQSEFAAAIAVIALTAMLFTAVLGVAVTSPIKRMTDYVRDISRRKTPLSRPKGLFKEFDEFAAAFNDMLEKLEVYYNDLHEQKVLLKNAEIKALQAQISPHFLFNVLNTIMWKAEIGGSGEIYQMVLSLSELLRANVLSIDRDYVTVREELDYARFYIYLQQQRFEGKINAEISCDGVSEEALVPRFCIQPLVENAIEHGFEPLPDDGSDRRLKISLSSENGGIRVTVEDNGAGFPDGFDAENLEPSEGRQHTRVGLKNLRQRLLLLAGRENGLKAESGGGGTVITFWLPETRGK
jgi:sensor histidine kinase YesM